MQRRARSEIVPLTFTPSRAPANDRVAVDWSLAYTTAERSKDIAVGRARASAASPRATRGTSTQSAPTAERSHCLQNGKQHDDGHDIAYDARCLWD